MEAREEERGLTPAGEGAQSELAIVSLLPSLTEVVAELGLAAKIADGIAEEERRRGYARQLCHWLGR